MVGEREPEHESGQHRARVRFVAEPHEQQEAGEDELDLRFDHAAVGGEEVGGAEEPVAGQPLNQNEHAGIPTDSRFIARIFAS